MNNNIVRADVSTGFRHLAQYVVAIVHHATHWHRHSPRQMKDIKSLPHQVNVERTTSTKPNDWYTKRGGKRVLAADGGWQEK